MAGSSGTLSWAQGRGLPLPRAKSDSSCLTFEEELTVSGGCGPATLKGGSEPRRSEGGAPAWPWSALPCRVGSRIVRRGRPGKRAWTDSSSHHVVGSEVWSGRPHCREPSEALWVVHGRGQDTEGQGEAGQTQSGGQREGGPVLDLLTPQKQGQQEGLPISSPEGPGSDPGGQRGFGGPARVDVWQ